jgi:hypothetical protein
MLSKTLERKRILDRHRSYGRHFIRIVQPLP